MVSVPLRGTFASFQSVRSPLPKRRQAISASGGYGSNTCAVTVGSLPAGLSLTGCSIGGTPSAAGTTNFTIQVSDSSTPAMTTTQAYSLVVAETKPTVSDSSASIGFNASATNIALTTSGTVASVTVVSGASHGTATASGATISYTPTTGYHGADSFTYKATNVAGDSVTNATVSITVADPTAVSITTAMAMA